MRYTQLVEQLYDEGRFYRESPYARYTQSKRAGRELAKKLGIPVPREIEIPHPYVIKQERNVHCGKGVMIVGNPQKHLIEEAVACYSGRVPPIDFKCFVFNGRVKLIKPTAREIQPGVQPGAALYCNWYTPDWRQFPVHVSPCKPKGEDRRLVLARPPHLKRLIDWAGAYGAEFPFPTRVDFYISDSRPLFGELMIFLGLVRTITPQADELFGQWWTGGDVP